MPNEPLNFVVVSPDDRFSVCIKYVFDLYARVYGHSYTLTGPDTVLADTDLVVIYGSFPYLCDKPTIRIRRSDFFGAMFGTNSEPPEDFRTAIKAAGGRRLELLAERTANSVICNADLVAAAFYLLSGYHDWASKKRDAYGRVLAADTELSPETWDVPLVNYWFRQLNELMLSLMQTGLVAEEKTQAFPTNQTVCLTHDVDLLRKYRLGNMPRQLWRARSAGISNELKRAKNVIGGQQLDPYDSFDSLYTVKERVAAPSTFFFMGSQPSARNGDYKVGDREARSLLVRAKSFGDEIGMHGSWESADSPHVVSSEKLAVEKAAAIPIYGSRQHYLRFNNPESWKELAKAGIRYDATGGFPDRCGFKYGWSGCFYPFDLNTMEQLPILEIPLVCMDVTLAAYEKIPAELALERLTNLLDAATDNVPGGAFVFLWHNTMADRVTYPGYWDTFEYFFSVASGSARFITLSALCDEFERQGV